MRISEWLPQVILVVFLLLGNVTMMKGTDDKSIMKTADEKTFRTTIFGTVVMLGILWWGGFFGR